MSLCFFRRDVDLFVGILKEARRTRGAGSILGVTASCIIADQFQRKGASKIQQFP